MTTHLTAAEFGATVAERMADPDSDFVLLTRDGGGVVAVFATPGGAFECFTAPVPAVRPSSCGGGAGLGDELDCPDGTWRETAPVFPKIHAEGSFTFPVGPVRGDTVESVGLRLRIVGDEILHLDVELDFKHRGIEAMFENAGMDQATAIAGRVTGTTTVSHGFAFARAVETALGIQVGSDIERIRCLAAEVERIACHLGDIGLLGGSTGLPVAQMEFLAWKESVLRSNAGFFGHRYLRGLIVPGGLSHAVTPDDVERWIRPILATRRLVERALSNLRETSSYVDRLVRAGRIPDPVIRYVRPVGPTGRSAGMNRDVRRDQPYSAYVTQPPSDVPGLSGADAYARFEVLARELMVSYTWLAEGASTVSSPVRAVDSSQVAIEGGGEADEKGSPRIGIGLVEGPRGPVAYRASVLAAQTLAHARLHACAVSSPSRRNWWTVPSAVTNGNTMQDVPIIDASFALSVSGAAL